MFYLLCYVIIMHMNELILIRGIVILELLCAYKQLHMLQLNSYNIDSHAIWLKKNLNYFLSHIILFFIAVLRLFLKSFLVDIVLVIVLFIILIENLPRKAKKAFVITNRIVRLIITSIVLLVLTYLPFIFSYIKPGQDIIREKTFFIVLLGLALEPLIIYLANIINTPIEKLLSMRFINDAKKMINDSKTLNVIGVTGSYGKTSVKNYLHHLLSLEYDALKTPDSFNTTLGVTRAIRENLNATHKFFIAEMGARRRGDISEICSIVNPKFCIISSIGPQHLDTFKNIENIARTKFELADAVIKNDGFCFVCGDNKYIKEKINTHPYKDYKKLFTYGLNPENDYYAKDIKIEEGITKWTMVDKINKNEFELETHLLGNHNVQNLVGVIALCLNNNLLTKDQIFERVKTIHPVPHRLEMKKFGNDILIDDAFNSNPDGAMAALNVLSTFKDYEKILITPGMVELGDSEEEENIKFGENASKICNIILLVGKKQAEVLSKKINLNDNLHEVKTFDKVEQAIAYASSYTSSGPKVILIENDLPDNYL